MSLLFTILALALAPGAPTDDARIEVDRQPDRYVITGHYAGSEASGLTYTLRVTREGSGGRSTSSQSGTVTVGVLSTSAVNVSAGDRLVVELVILDGDRRVTEDSLEEIVGS